MKMGDNIAQAGDTGVGNAHIHSAKSYPLYTAPATAEQVIQAFSRDYVRGHSQGDTKSIVNSPSFQRERVLSLIK
ncbi:MAG: hypothetical protein PQJ50_06125 [Spirochaetales bacterium]|nr:hypothetical protein [Spirochaetales bacterium]